MRKLHFLSFVVSAVLIFLIAEANWINLGTKFICSTVVVGLAIIFNVLFSGTDESDKKADFILDCYNEFEFVGYDRVQGLLYNSVKNAIDFIYSGSHSLPNDFYRGILINGKSGVGKSLFVKQILSNFDVPKYYVDFAYSYDVNPVKAVFFYAKKEKDGSPCIIFFDSLNKISDKYVGCLVREMEKIQDHDIIIVAATNNLNKVDRKLISLFDQKIDMNMPNKADRIEMFYEVLGHLDIDFDEDDLDELAKWTNGMTGKEIKAFIYETYKSSKFDDYLNLDDFRNGLKCFIYGHSVYCEQTFMDLKRTAYHEAGHAIVDGILNNHEIIEIFISQREYVKGAVLFSDSCLLNMSKEDYLNEIDVAVAGLIAEEIIFGSSDDGVIDDLKNATRLAQDMVLKCGMDKDFGPVGIEMSDRRDGIYCKKEYVKDSTISVRKILKDSCLRVEAILKKNKNLLDKVADSLLASEKKSISGKEFSAIVKEIPYVE